MVKFLTALGLTILLGYTAFVFSDAIPWWGFAIGAFLAGASVPQKAWLSWISGFIGMLLCWGFLSWHINALNNGLMAKKMAEILPLNGSVSAIILVTALLAAIIGGFASITGAFIRKKPTIKILL